MTDPIPPISESCHVMGPAFIEGSRGMAAALIRDEGYPYTAEAQREVFEDARQLINESFRRRRIPTPPGGWTLAFIHPEEPWQNHIAPDIAQKITADLIDHPSTAVIAVVVVYAKTT